MKKGILFLIVLLVVTLLLLFFVKSEIDRKGVDEKMVDVLENDSFLNSIFLDVGQGDATFITFPDGQQMLIDCAKDARIIEALGRVMPFYDRDIEYLVVTHPDLDHYGGCIDVLKRFDVEHLVYNGLEKPEDQLWQEFNELIDTFKEKQQYTRVDKSYMWNIASTTVHFLYPNSFVSAKETESNNSSIVMKFTYGDQDMLMTGDAEEDIEEYLITTYGKQLDVEMLKAGHHGSNSSSIEEFVSSTRPKVAIVSAGKNNRFGHPTRRVLKRFERASTTVWRTDVHGDILLSITTSSFFVTPQFQSI